MIIRLASSEGITLNSAEPLELEPSIEKMPLAEFDRDYIPEDEESRKVRQFMLNCVDLGIKAHAYAVNLAMQEARHQRQELIAMKFGRIGERQFLLGLLLEAHFGDERAMKDWTELAQSAAVHLRDDGILSDMQKATVAVAMVLKHKLGEKDRARFVAAYFALTWKQHAGSFPTKAEVMRFLKDRNISTPEPRNMHRFWRGAILGRLKGAKRGRKPAARKLSSKKKSR
jgi:hypothetical protein